MKGSVEFSKSRHGPKNVTRPSCRNTTRVGEFAREMRIVRHDDGSLVVHLFQACRIRSPMCAGHQRIDHRRRLVIKDGIGILSECARDGDGALRTRAEFRGKAIEIIA